MYLPKNLNLSTISINSYYLPWLISFFVATALILIILVIVIIICSSFKKKRKLIINKSLNHVDGGIFVVNGNGNLDKMRDDWLSNKSEEVSFKKTIDKDKRFIYYCCCALQKDSIQQSTEEGFGLLGGSSKNITKVDMRDKERNVPMDFFSNPESIPDLSATASDGMSDHETGRISHIDRELPPIPKISKIDLNTTSFINQAIESEMVSMTESCNYNDLKPSDETDIDQRNCASGDDSTISTEPFESTNHSPMKFEKSQRSSIDCTNCCCGSHQEILSSDDLSSNDYDPTYAAIKRKRRGCPLCGVPSVYTPANSNRNSNLSLQFNSCLTSPIRHVSMKPLVTQKCDSMNNSTYASIAKLPKIIPENNMNKDQDNSGSSTIKRQRSISQGNIIRSSILKAHELQENELSVKNPHSNTQNKDMSKTPNVNKNSPFSTISLWSLMASNRNSPYSMFPSIPERTYGQSVVDLIEKLRESEQPDRSIKQSCFHLNDTERSFTPPLFFNNSFKKPGTRGRVWTPPSCQMIHGSTLTKTGLCSPLKIFDRNSNSYEFNFPEMIGSYRKGSSSFHPILTPPLSPMDCLGSEKNETCEIPKSISLQENDITSDLKFVLDSKNDNNNNKGFIQATSIYEDLDYESGLAADKEIEGINNEVDLYMKESNDYDYILNPGQNDINGDLILNEYQDDTITSRIRPISIHLYSDESLTSDLSLKYRLEKCDIFGFSSVQMSPLMEQSIENSSSKTTLSSLSFHQFNRLMSSEDSCAKSPPSAELSPSLDNFEISTENGAFLYNDMMWSKLNVAFDDYDTFE